MSRSFTRSRGLALTLICAALLFTVGLWGCSGVDNTPVAPAAPPVGLLSEAHPQLQSVMAIQNAHTKRLMEDVDVIGTATTINDEGRPAIMLLVTTPRAFKSAPSEIDGVPVMPVFTDKIVAMKGKPGGGGGVSHTAKQSTPVQLGTSGGWGYDLANGYCCGGTLGSLIQKGNTQYILSNYHVLEGDIVNGGNSRTAQNGDPVIQPGLIDVGCNANNAQVVGTLSLQHALPGSNVDCAIAAASSGMVSTDGAILEVGTISSSIVGASINQAVKKSGRTTGLSRSTVSGLNATVSVAYENECAGGTAFTKTFTGQIIIANRRSKFLAGGDSGSLMVEDVATNPRAVGLLFAGSNTTAVANPIGQVLSFLGASMVGN